MVITPLDIENKDFNNSFRGYNKDEVNTYMKKVLQEFEKIYQENQLLKNKINLFEEQIERYKNLENSLNETLIIAQKTAEELKNNAHNEANLIKDKAENRAKEIIQNAEEKVRIKEEEIIRIEEQYKKIKSQIKHIMLTHLEMLENS
jgi:cell division initiation protein